MVDTVLSITEKYEIGMKSLRQIFQMNSAEIKATVNSICGDRIPNEHILMEGSVKKVSNNDEPEKIEIWFYDHISITAFGISYNPEHGQSRELVEFNKFFTIPKD